MSASPSFIQGKHWTYSVVGTKLYLLISDINSVVEFCIELNLNENDYAIIMELKFKKFDFQTENSF